MILTVMRKYGQGLWRCGLCLSVFLVAVLTGGDTERIAPFSVALVLLLSLGLVFFKSAEYLTLPFLQLTLLVIFCYDSFTVFIRYVWLVPVAVLALAVFLIKRRPPLFKGPTLLPLAAVSVATILGGVGLISAADYFRGASLGFMLGLGPALLLSYWIMKHELASPRSRDFFLLDLVCWGLTAAAVTFWYVVPLAVKHGGPFGFTEPQWSNNISTMLMIAMPATLALKRRHVGHYLMLGVMFAATMLVGSRGGQLLVGLEVIVCCFWAWRSESDIIKRLWNRTYFLWVLMAAGYVFSLVVINVVSLDLVSSDEPRALLFLRSLENIKENWLFGTGLGYRGNADIYSAKEGAINWYHMMIPQIIGSLGLCGVAAWGYQLFVRAKLSLAVWKNREFGFALCYFGLFLMSQVNPGEFCPVPYAFLAVCFFAAIENSMGEQHGKVPQVHG